MRSTGQTTMRHRGLAMVLVLISMAMATIIVMSYIASRDNSAAIGRNVVNSVDARSQATSALNLGIAILETPTAWRTAHTNGKLLDDYPFGTATIDLDLIDVDTGLPPDTDSTTIEVTATAIVDGIEHVAIGLAEVATSTDQVDVDLGEFALFGRDHILLDNDATVARWPSAPASGAGRRIAVGTQGTSSSTIELLANAAIIDGTVYHAPGASASLVRNDSGPVIQQDQLNDVIPLPETRSPGVALPSGGGADVNINAATQTISASDRVNSLQLDLNATVIFDTDITYVVETDASIGDSRIVIDADVTLVVFEDLRMNTSAIEVRDGASLTLFIGDDFVLLDSYIGEERADAVRDYSGGEEYMDPSRIRIYDIPTYVVDMQMWILRANSVAKASIYAPENRMIITDQSALYGRLAAQEIIVQRDGAIFYDHALDGGNGYVNPNSEFFDGAGDMKADFTALATLNPAELDALAAAQNLVVNADGSQYGDVSSVIVVSVPGVATPRTLAVDYKVLSLGADVTTWESDTDAKIQIIAP